MTLASEDAVVLFVHEIHRVRGASEEEFEAAFRDSGGWMDSLAKANDDARLLFYANQAHGSGPSYRVVTITAVRTGQAAQELAERTQHGDLHTWAAQVERLRHDVRTRVLLPLAWMDHTPDLAAVPTNATPHELRLYMEDTMWPFQGRLLDYIEQAGTHYRRLLERPAALLELTAAFAPAIGGGCRPEVTLLQRVRKPDAIADLLATELPPAAHTPGSWMHDALALRDQWQSRLLRTSSWSPWW